MPWNLPKTIVQNAIKLCQMPSDCAKCHQIVPNAISIVPNVNVRLKFNIDFAESFIPMALKVKFLCFAINDYNCTESTYYNIFVCGNTA
jgi:hypothetical protein